MLFQAVNNVKLNFNAGLFSSTFSFDHSFYFLVFYVFPCIFLCKLKLRFSHERVLSQVQPGTAGNSQVQQGTARYSRVQSGSARQPGSPFSSEYKAFSHHNQGSIDFNTFNIHHTVGKYFLIFTYNRDDIEWKDLQRSYFPIHSQPPRECIGKYCPRDTPKGEYQAHVSYVSAWCQRHLLSHNCHRWPWWHLHFSYP